MTVTIPTFVTVERLLKKDYFNLVLNHFIHLGMQMMLLGMDLFEVSLAWCWCNFSIAADA